MKAQRLNPRRYQLKKEGVRALLAGHPWIFRSHVSTAVEGFPDGQWLRLVDHANEILGYGIYEQQGLIGIRVLKRGNKLPAPEWLQRQLSLRLQKRRHLMGYSDAFRAIHGENDGFPGVVVDVYKDTAVLQTYTAGADTLGRYLAEAVMTQLQLKRLVWKVPSKRKVKREGEAFRTLRGALTGPIPFREGKLRLTVDLREGQKSGTFLDLRGLRKWVASQELAGKRVLNLFSYTGTLGLAAEIAGAKEIWNVDISQGALDFAKKYHAIDRTKHRFIAADVFQWVKELPKGERFDLIIVDPPSMAARTEQVPGALKAYRDLYRALLPHLAPRAKMAACCCTSRIARKRFRLEIDKAIGDRLRFTQTIEPEDDHPVGFPEGDYLKLLVYSTSR